MSYILCKFSVVLFQDKTVTLSQQDFFYVMFLILIVVSAQFSTLLVNSCYMHNFILILRKKEIKPVCNKMCALSIFAEFYLEKNLNYTLLKEIKCEGNTRR